MGHVVIVAALAASVKSAASLMPSQIAFESSADVIKFVEKRDELVVEILIEETRQAESHQVEHLAAVDDVALHLEERAVPSPREPAMSKAKRRDSGLQAEGSAAACLRHAEQKS